MLNFFVRFLIIIFFLIICIGFASAILSIPLILPIIFGCSWVFVKSFEEVFWEISIFALIYDFLASSHIGIYFLVIFSTVIIFNFINYSIFEVSGKRIFLAYIGVSFLTTAVVVANYFFERNEINYLFLGRQIFFYILISVFYFFIFSKLISRSEKVISFYTQKIDVKRHL
ncbi:MAG: hypothetical protein KAT32_00150 [Candidatus Moranbacteria bacterium]|nr:hypothetical protein [Candidatus Moranbacteria bacterium]